MSGEWRGAGERRSRWRRRGGAEGRSWCRVHFFAHSLSGCLQLLTTRLLSSPVSAHSSTTPPVSILRSLIRCMKRQRDFDPYPPSSTASNAYTPYPPSTSARQPLPMPSFGGGSGRRGSNRQPASNASKRVKVGGGQSAAPLVSPPLHDAAYVTSCYNALGGRGEPNK